MKIVAFKKYFLTHFLLPSFITLIGLTVVTQWWMVGPEILVFMQLTFVLSLGSGILGLMIWNENPKIYAGIPVSLSVIIWYIAFGSF